MAPTTRFLRALLVRQSERIRSQSIDENADWGRQNDPKLGSPKMLSFQGARSNKNLDLLVTSMQKEKVNQH